MKSDLHIFGLDGPQPSYVLIGLGPETDRAVLIKLKDAGALARSQGGMATLAQGIAPAMIEGKVYDEFSKQMRDKLKAQNVDADVTVVQPATWKPANGSHVATDLGFLFGGMAIAGLLVWIFRK